MTSVVGSAGNVGGEAEGGRWGSWEERCFLGSSKPIVEKEEEEEGVL